MQVRESYLLKIDTPTPARIWSGVGDLMIPADIVEAVQSKYLGAGQLLNAPDFQQLINGVAERLEFTVSGINAETMRLAAADAPTVPGSSVYLGRVDFNEDWQIIAVEWEATFRCDVLMLDSNSTGGTRTRTITLSVGTDDTGRSYSPTAFFTDADQRRRSISDRFFDRIAEINNGTARVFGGRYNQQSTGLF